MINRIVITQPFFSAGEGPRIASILDSGATRVHLRKPGSSIEDMRALIESVPERYRLRLSLHDHLGLATEYGIGGVHLNKRCSEVPVGFHGFVSRSCHTIEELALYRDADYLFLCPVFDSISKSGYSSHFTPEELRQAARYGLIDEHVYALGGIDGSRLREVEELGFGGAAMLGAAWMAPDSDKFKLQYIASSADEVEAVLRGGCRWIQLRMKEASTIEIIAAAKRVAAQCRRYDAIFLLDDRVDLVAATGAHGVHLGRNDMPVDQARRLLGPGYIIGATANDFDTIARATALGADYIGLGPLRFTTTKKNLSPVLGFSGYTSIMEQCRKGGHCIPVVAIGGIVEPDVAPLAEAGVQGVAVSGSIARADDPAVATANFVNLLKLNIKCKN